MAGWKGSASWCRCAVRASEGGYGSGKLPCAVSTEARTLIESADTPAGLCGATVADGGADDLVARSGRGPWEGRNCGLLALLLSASLHIGRKR